MLSNLPVNLRTELVFAMYSKHVRNIPFLYLVEERNPGAAALIMPMLKPSIFTKDSVLVSSTLCSRELIFVLQGTCSCYSSLSGRRLCTYESGEWFGEVCHMLW